MLWEKHCRFAAEETWCRHRLSRGQNATAFLEYQHPDGRYLRVRAKLISWVALLVGPYWILAKRQWMPALVLIGVEILLLLYAGTLWVVVVLLHITLALAGTNLLDLYLQRKGYSCRVLIREMTNMGRYEGYITNWYSYDEDGWKYTRKKEFEDQLYEEVRQEEDFQRKEFMDELRMKENLGKLKTKP